MVKTCADICEMEKTWFLNKCWILGEEMGMSNFSSEVSYHKENEPR